jgi:metallo-beta-lactamase family protein
VVQLQAASAHADANQILDWLRLMPGRPDQTYIIHGDMAASDTLRQRIEHELSWRALVPEHGSTWPC